MTKINMKITHLKCHSNLPGANELSHGSRRGPKPQYDKFVAYVPVQNITKW